MIANLHGTWAGAIVFKRIRQTNWLFHPLSWNRATHTHTSIFSIIFQHDVEWPMSRRSTRVQVLKKENQKFPRIQKISWGLSWPFEEQAMEAIPTGRPGLCIKKPSRLWTLEPFPAVATIPPSFEPSLPEFPSLPPPTFNLFPPLEET